MHVRVMRLLAVSIRGRPRNSARRMPDAPSQVPAMVLPLVLGLPNPLIAAVERVRILVHSIVPSPALPSHECRVHRGAPLAPSGGLAVRVVLSLAFRFQGLRIPAPVCIVVVAVQAFAHKRVMLEAVVTAARVIHAMRSSRAAPIVAHELNLLEINPAGRPIG